MNRKQMAEVLGIKPEMIDHSLYDLAVMEDVDLCGKSVSYSIYAADDRVTVLCHEVSIGAPLIGAFRFTTDQWLNLKKAVDPLIEAHEQHRSR